MLYEDSLWESKVLQKKVMNVKLLAANSTGQLKRLFEAFYTVRQMDETDFIFVRVPAEDIGSRACDTAAAILLLCREFAEAGDASVFL